MNVAIIGAGIAGLRCGQLLKEGGVRVSIFDKGRFVGGRLSTRTRSGHFDHGAQYVTARAPTFVAQMERWLAKGIAARWKFRHLDLATGAVTAKERTLGSERARRLAEALAAELPIELETEVAPLDGHTLRDTGGKALGTFDSIVVTAPTVQTRRLLAAYPSLLAPLAPIEHAPCWALMVDFETPWTIDADVLAHGNAIAWAAREASKPGRPKTNGWIVHASPEWSRANLELDREQAAVALFDELRTLGELPPLTHQKAHRWRYAQVVRAAEIPCVVGEGIAIAGDGLLGPRVEAAWLSGEAAAQRLLEAR
ncbi:MAG: NAD(P)-binding protein [Myxococcota bacterium]